MVASAWLSWLFYDYCLKDHPHAGGWLIHLIHCMAAVEALVVDALISEQHSSRAGVPLNESDTRGKQLWKVAVVFQTNIFNLHIAAATCFHLLFSPVLQS